MKITVETNEDTGKRTIDVDGVLTSKEHVSDFITLLQTVGYQVFPYHDVRPAPPPSRPASDDEPL